MYEIWADDLLIYSDITPLESVKVIDPTLTLADSAAGSLEMTLPPTNAGYFEIKRMTTDIIVTCDREEIWRGRVLTDDYDFWNRRKMVCEGELAFLNDTIQPPARYLSENTTITTFITSLINIHNANVGDNRKFEIGMITVDDGDQQEDDDAIYRYTNYESTLQCLNEKLVDRLGGHLRVRHQVVNGTDHRYLDYISDESIGQNNQIIRFGVNLMDFVKSFDMSELATVLVPRGARLDDEEIEGLESYLTIKDCATVENEHELGTIYIRNQNAVDTYGWIEAVVDWDQVNDKDILYSKAKKYLEDEQYEKMVLEIKALDLHYAGVENQRIKMLDKLRCISEPHGMDHTFPVTQMEIKLDRPDDSIYTLGTDVVLTLTESTSKISQETLAKIGTLPSKHSILKAAQENAFKILTGADGGYVRFEVYSNDPEDPHYNPDPNMWDVIHSIIISDGPTDEMSLHKWVWNENGLGHMTRDNYPSEAPFPEPPYSDESYPWTSVNVALTYDGSIVADRITTGVLRAYNVNEGGEVYALNTATGYIKMLYGEIGDFTFQKVTGSHNPFKNQRILLKNSALVSESQFGCGKAGLGVVNMVGGRSSGHERYGFIQMSNSGNFFDDTLDECVDGIRIYGDGTIKHFNGNGDEDWSRDLSDIPS